MCDFFGLPRRRNYKATGAAVATDDDKCCWSLFDFEILSSVWQTRFGAGGGDLIKIINIKTSQKSHSIRAKQGKRSKKRKKVK